jgi:hypothetical protein
VGIPFSDECIAVIVELVEEDSGEQPEMCWVPDIEEEVSL